MSDESEDRSRREHRFSAGQGFDDPYRGFDLDPPELTVDPDVVDPVDDRVITDLLDEQNVTPEDVNTDALIDIGLEYIGINRFEQAIDAFERAARFTETDHVAQEAWVNKGIAHAELEEYDQAVSAYREALSIDDESDLAALASTNLAYAYWEWGEDERAFQHAERAVELDPRLPQAWYNRGFILLERGLAEDAVTAFENAQRLGYRSVELYEEHARALEAVGEYDEAEEMMERAESVREDIEAELLE